MSNMKVPIPQKGRTDAETLQNVLDAYARLARAFSAFQNAIGSENIPLLITNETQIRSDDGATEIVGPLLVMKDKQTVPITRILMGYDAATDKFVFEIYNAAGTKSIGIDDAGDGTFTGTITGGTLKTAASGARIEMTGNKLTTYNLSNQKQGISWGYGIGSLFGDISLYDGDVEVLRIQNKTVGAGFMITAENGAALGLGDTGTDVFPGGIWECALSTFNHLEDEDGLYATQNWVEDQGYITGYSPSGFTGTKVIGGETYTWEDGLLISVV